jgi:hypothetical protein
LSGYSAIAATRVSTNVACDLVASTLDFIHAHWTKLALLVCEITIYTTVQLPHFTFMAPEENTSQGF